MKNEGLISKLLFITLGFGTVSGMTTAALATYLYAPDPWNLILFMVIIVFIVAAAVVFAAAWKVER